MTEDNNSFKTVTCNKCKWVSFAVTLAYAKEEVRRFNEYYAGLSPEHKDNYAGPSSLESDYRCQLCGGQEFHPSEPGDCPDGCTISPVVYEEP